MCSPDSVSLETCYWINYSTRHILRKTLQGLVTGNVYGILQEKDTQIKWGPDSGLAGYGSECWDSRAEHTSFHRIGDSPTWWPRHVPGQTLETQQWPLYPGYTNSAPLMTTKSSPHLPGLSAIPDQDPQLSWYFLSPLSGPASSPCPGMAWHTVGTTNVYRWMFLNLSSTLNVFLSFTQKWWFHCKTWQTVPKQRGRKTLKSYLSLRKMAGCLWHCRINETAVSGSCVIQLWEDEHSIKIWGYSLGQVTNSTFF